MDRGGQGLSPVPEGASGGDWEEQEMWSWKLGVQGGGNEQQSMTAIISGDSKATGDMDENSLGAGRSKILIEVFIKR